MKLTKSYFKVDTLLYESVHRRMPLKIGLNRPI